MQIMITTGSDNEAGVLRGVLRDTMFAAIPSEDPGTHTYNTHILVNSLLTKHRK